MTNKCLISIIIPVYNVEKYLSECLDGILIRQNFNDFELLLINDGSVDKSPEICDSYAEQYSKVRVIHKTNGGASSARNTGLNEAVGKYILFIDADDYIADFSLEKIAELIKKEGDSDLVMLNSIDVYTDGSMKQRDTYNKECFYKQSHEDVLKHISAHLPDCVWGKLIKRELLLKNNIFFITGIICEDVDFTMKLFMHAKTYNTAEFNYYYYRVGRTGSVMNVQSSRMFSDLLYIVSKWTELTETTYIEYAQVLRRWNLYNYCWVVLPRYLIIPNEIKKSNKDKVKKIRNILNYSNNWKVKVVRTIFKIFGVWCASFWAAGFSVLFKPKEG